MKRIDCHVKLWFFLVFMMSRVTSFANDSGNRTPPPSPVAFTVMEKWWTLKVAASRERPLCKRAPKC